MSELYALPDGWEWKKLGDITTVIGGGTPRTNIKEYWKNGNIIWLSPTDLGNIGEIISINNSKTKITKLGLEKSSAKLLPIGTVLFSSRATIGKIAINEIEVSTNQGFTNFICKDLLLNKYLAFCLNRFTSDITDLSNSTTFKEVSKSSLKDFKIPLPSLEEQKRIVDKLDILFAKIDKAIALHQKNIDEANVFMASVLNDVFVELEEKYEKKQLNEIVIFGGKNISTLEYPNLIYFSLEDVEAQTGRILNYKTVNEAGVKGTAVRFDENVVLYSKLRPYLNKVIVPNLEGCSTTELVVLKPKDKLDKYFLASYLRSSNIVNFLNNDSMGAKMPRTNMKTFRNLEISFPPYETQQKVVAYLDEISSKMEKIKQIQKEKMQSLKALKASILDQAFKGEL